MLSPNGSLTTTSRQHKLQIFFTVLLLVSMACSLPSFGQKATEEPVQPGQAGEPQPGTTSEPGATPTAQPSPTLPPEPLPPALVEASPLPGSTLPLQGEITLYFNQPMDQASVEAALSGEPQLSGTLVWLDDATLTYTPDQPLLPGTTQSITVGASAQSQDSIAMQAPISLTYLTSGYLQVGQALPLAGRQDVSPTSAIVATFNQPVTELGADPARLPAGFNLEPQAEGSGEWVNTSTYIFYPEPGLMGGTKYTVQVNPSLVSTGGSPLEGEYSWSFRTVKPRLVTLEPGQDRFDTPLDAVITMTFNVSMDTASVEQYFSLVDARGEAVTGDFGWNEDLTSLVYTPTALLARDTQYVVTLAPEAAAAGGTPTGIRYESNWFTVPDLRVLSTDPPEGGSKITYEPIRINLSSYISVENLEDYLTLTPEVSNFSAYAPTYERSIYVHGMFQPDTPYTLTISGELADKWGSSLGEDFTLNLRTRPASPDLTIPYYNDTSYLTTQDAGILVLATNLDSLPVTVSSIDLQDFIELDSSYDYEVRTNYQPDEPRSWIQAVNAPRNQTVKVTIPLSPNQQPVVPGLYYVWLNPAVDFPPRPLLVAVSNYQMTLKASQDQALVWAVDTRTNQPAAGIPLSIYDKNSRVLASGQTGADGIFTATLPESEEIYGLLYAVLGTPGQADFGLAISNWNSAISTWDFGLSSNFFPSELKVYLYTDRPIYRPGQTIYFRAVVRQAENGRYSLPDLTSYRLTMKDGGGQEQAVFDLTLSSFGTAYGEYTLPEDAQPGYYNLANDEDEVSLYIQVAEYRKPEINLQVELAEEQILAGEAVVAQVNARYFFDAPVNELTVYWALYVRDSYFTIPGNYQVGPYDTNWLEAFHYPYMGGGLGRQVSQGEAVTNADGVFTLELPTEAGPGRSIYTLEVTASDESGLWVSARDTVYANPADFYIGIHPDAWAGQAGDLSGFDVLTVDWDGQPSGNHSLTALFQRVEWERTDPPAEMASYTGPTYERVYTTIATQDFSTKADGTARLSFTPDEPGTYQLDVSGQGTTTQVLVWIGGSGSGIWPDLPNQRLRLTADAEAYQPGDTASIFIPNPFNAPALALLTVERSLIMQHELLQVETGGLNYSLPLSAEHAPNIYVAVTLLGSDAQGRPDFRQGYVELRVDPAQQILSVSLTSEPERSGPGDEVTFHLRVTDSAGKPVQGEFSLSVVDLALLALADPYAKDINSAFYGKQPIGVRTGISLAASSQRLNYIAGGVGGGGGDEGAPMVREDFPDTAYWNPVIVTDQNGEASLTIALPDSLTTWQVLARGLTAASLTGEAQVNLVTTQEVLVRPVTPRFLVANDHVQLAAVVNNNTTHELRAEVTLQSNGFTLDDIATASQAITLPAGGRVRVEWWGRAAAVDSADLLFSLLATDATGSSYQDAVRVAQGALPILSYTTPQTFATSGVLDTPGERLELISLPVSYDITQGELQVDLSTSVAGVILDTLAVLEQPRYNCNEQVLSSFFPNLQAYRVLQSFGIEAAELETRLESSLKDNVETLLLRQNTDGGWGWWPGQETNQTITAYILFGLSNAQQAGISIPDQAIQDAVLALVSTLYTPNKQTQAWQLNQLAFVNFALSEADNGNAALAAKLYAVRDQLGPWAQALLALTLETLNPGNPETDTLLSDLQTSAVRSASGVHWEEAQPDYHNLTSHTTTTAMVIYALAQLDPASLLLPDAVNYQIASRLPYGGWGSTYDDAWTVMAMSEYMRGSGELSSSYDFEARLNRTPIASGSAGGDTNLTTVSSTQPVSALYPDDPNALVIRRGEGGGRLYYNASLQVYQPVEQVTALSRGMSLTRAYYPAGADLKSASPITGDKMGGAVTVRLTLVLPSEAYYLVVEDYIPAGTEILNTSLKTVQQDEFGEPGPLYDPDDPFGGGWGWWLFDPARIYDERIAFTASYLPAGTYELTYTLMLLQPGEYHVLPAQAWLFYFPEVQGSSAGEIFEIKP